jgi:uncharacterized membrane protein YGL010W
MAAVESDVVDNRRRIDRLLGNYSEDHRNAVNQTVHHICVPVIVWTVMALLWTIPVPAAIGRPGFWAGMGMVAAVGYYFRLSRVMGLAMFAVFVVYGVFTHWLYGQIGARGLLFTAVAVFVLAWIAQFIGHHIEGKRPSFLTDMVYLMVGPLWVISKLLRRLGVAY